MKPIINTVDLTELSSNQRKKICECPKACDKGISFTTHDTGFIICWNQGRKTLYELIKTLEENTHTTWTNEDEDFVIRHIQKHGTYYGVNRILGESLGKTTLQIKGKVRALRKAGKLK